MPNKKDQVPMQGVTVQETYKLNPDKLTEIMSMLHALDIAAFFREEGTIGIRGTLFDNNGARVYTDIGRLLEGSYIGKQPNTLYLQTLAHKGFHKSDDTKPDLVKLLRQYVI